MRFCLLTPFGGRSLCRLIGLLLPLTAAQVGEAQSSVWGLKTGDVFAVSISHDKSTTLHVAEGPPIRSSTSDLIEVQYLVRDLDPTGDMMVEAQIVRSLRASGNDGEAVSLEASRRLQLLEGVAITLRVSPDGVIDAIAEGDRRTLINQLTGLNAENAFTLNEMLSDETVVSLLGRPFWFVIPVAQGRPQESWIRKDCISLGLCGELKSTVRCQVAGEDVERTVTMTGDARFVPRIAGAKSASTPELQNVAVTVQRYDGEGTMVIKPEDQDRPSGYQPHFKNMHLRVEFGGTFDLTTADRKLPVELHQDQDIRIRLDGWRTGRRDPIPSSPPLENPQ